MAIKPISLRELEKRTEDIYEAVVVMSQRARQIVKDDLAQQAFKDAEGVELGVLDEIPDASQEQMEEKEKPTTRSLKEFLSGDLKWHSLDESER